MWPTHYIPNQPRIEGDPPPRYYLTSPPYSMQIIEDLASDFGEPSVGFNPSAEITETLSPSCVPTAGELRDVLLRLTQEPESIEVTFAPTAGVLRDVLVTHTLEPEEFEVSFAPLSGVLRDPLVRYENWPLGFATEDLQSTCVPLGGTLT